MAFYYDEQQGKWVNDEEQEEQQQPLTPFERSQLSRDERLAPVATPEPTLDEQFAADLEKEQNT